MLRNLWSRWKRFLIRLSGDNDTEITNFEAVWVTLVLLIFLLMFFGYLHIIPEDFAIAAMSILVPLTVAIVLSVTLIQWILAIAQCIWSVIRGRR